MDMELDLKDIITEAKADIIEKARADLAQSVTWAVNKELNAQLSEMIKDFITTEIAPILRDKLVGQKSVIIEAIDRDLPKVGEAVIKAIVAEMTENLAQSYRRDKIIEALLK